MADKEKRYVVTGAAVVLPTKSSERYLYRHATFSAGEFTEAGIKAALENKLIAEHKVAEPEPAPAPQKAESEPFKGQTIDDLKTEIAKRNDGREDAAQIKVDGTKRDDFVAALVADDEKSKQQ